MSFFRVNSGFITITGNSIRVYHFYKLLSSSLKREVLHFYDFTAKAIQAIQCSHQFGTISSFDVEYPKIKSDIPLGIEENGVILVEPLDYTESSQDHIACKCRTWK